MSVIPRKIIFFPPFFSALVSVFLMSCIGASSQITINTNGSGTIIQEYRISLELQDMGKTEENEGMLPIPTGMEDLERTVERIPGLSLVSYSTRQDEKDLFLKAELAFETPEALSALMESGDQKLSINFINKKIHMHFSPGEVGDTSFKSMIDTAFKGYDFSISFSVPGTAKAAWYDENGKSIQQYPGNCTIRDRTVSYSVAMAELMYLENSLDLEISW